MKYPSVYGGQRHPEHRETAILTLNLIQII
jgi:hypothetical protein